MELDPAILDRTLASIRSNFESLRRFDPIPALMAEIPQWANWEFGGPTATVGNPQPWHRDWHKPNRGFVGGYVTKAGPYRLARLIWTLGERGETATLESAAAAAATAGLVNMLCEGASVPKDFWPAGENLGVFGWPYFGTVPLNGTAGHWFMGVFLAAAAKPRHSPLRLSGLLGVEVWRVDEASPISAPDPLPPEFSREKSAARYWELPNFVEASLWALDLADVALAATLERERGSGAPTPEKLQERGPGLTEKRRRGRPHKRSVAGLTCNQWLAAEFAADPEVSRLTDKQLEERAKEQGVDWDDRTIGTCEIRKAQRAQDLAQAEADQLATADDLGDDLPANGLHLSTRKTVTGRQKGKSPADRAEDAADRARDAEAAAFIDNAERQRRRTK